MSDPARVEIPRLSMLDDVKPAEDWPDRLGESAEERADRQVKAGAAKRRVWEANRPSRFASATLGELDGDQHPTRLSGWLDRDDVLGLVLTGATGTGKSHAAYAVGNTAVATGLWAACWSMVAFNDAARPGNDPTAYTTACACDLLLLDDVGRERMTDWTHERLQGVLDARWGAGLRTIVTSNLTGAAFGQRYGDPITDRVTDSAWMLAFDGASRRAKAPW